MFIKRYYLLILFPMFLLISCNEDDETVDCEEVEFSVSIEQLTDETCEEQGKISFDVLGGEEPYEYSADGVTFQESSTFDLDAGFYWLTVRDANQCQVKYDFTIFLDVSELTLNGSVTDFAGCGSSEGVIEVSGSSDNGGEVQFNIDGGSFIAINEFTGLSSGDHIVGIKDDAGCESDTVLYVPSGISYAASVASIIENNCAVTGCHVAGTGKPNFTEFSILKEYAEKIKVKTGDKTMPPTTSGRTLTDTEIAAIACWVDDDALNN